MTARDPRFLLAAILLLGYYAILVLIGLQPRPLANLDVVKDGMLVLGTPVGAVFNSLFRNDSTDEKRAENTATALRTAEAAVTAATPAPTTVLKPGETAQAAPVDNQGA